MNNANIGTCNAATRRTTAWLVPSRMTALLKSAVLFVAMMPIVAPAARASTFVVPDLDQLVSMSSAVVRGTVISATCRRADNNRIVTDYTIMVEEVATGKLDDDSATMTFTMPGGTIGDVGEMVTGVPVFRTGDQVVLFVKGHMGPARDSISPNRYMVTGMAVGALRVETTIDGTRIVRGLAARAFGRRAEHRSGNMVVSTVTDDTNEAAPLDAFMDAVREIGKGAAR